MSSPEPLRTALAGLAGLVAMLLWEASLNADAIVVRATGRQADKPSVRVPTTAAQWEAEAPSVRARLQRVLNLPAAPTVQGHVLARALREGHVQQELQLNDGGGRTIAGRALIPQEHVGRGPAVLYLAGVPQSPGVALAEQLPWRGTLVFEFRTNVRTLDGALRDAWLALQYVLKRRDVDPERVAVCGAGAGGTRAMLLAALQPQVAMAISLGAERAPDARHLGLIAPRPLLVLSAGKRMALAEQSRAAVETGRQFYRLYDLPELFHAAELPDAGEPPTTRMWQEAAAWLAEEL